MDDSQMDQSQIESTIFDGVEHPAEMPEMGVSPTRWQENHGNFLMGFVSVILVLGAIVLAYRQNRFVPPSFPEGQFIETVNDGEMVPETISENTVGIEVIGAVSDVGKLAIAIFDAETSFNQPSEAMLAVAAEITNGSSIWIVDWDRLPKRFAIAAYHDENLDAQLNRNRFGIPTERYGFSRNARGLVGPPTFEQAVIDRPAPGETIVITIR